MGLIPKKILEKLPDGYQNYFTPILFAFIELKRGNDLGLFRYKINDDGNVKLTGDNNYQRKKKEIESLEKKLAPLIPQGTILITIPRNYPEIRKDLEIQISTFTNQNNVSYVIEALFGTQRLSKKNENEKFGIWLSKEIEANKKLSSRKMRK